MWVELLSTSERTTQCSFDNRLTEKSNEDYLLHRLNIFLLIEKEIQWDI